MAGASGPESSLDPASGATPDQWVGQPNVFLVGAAKSGTSSFARYLAQHPAVFLPESKEPNYYVAATTGLNARGPASTARISTQLHRFSITTRDDYERAYRSGGRHPVRLDASVRYLYHRDALRAVAADNPTARYIVLLRNPADRLVSHWRMNRQQHLEPLGLRDALHQEAERVECGWGWDWHYSRLSDYGPQLEHLFSLVGRDRVQVLYYGDFAADPTMVLSSTLDFLGLPACNFDTAVRAMVPHDFRVAWLDRLIHVPNGVQSKVRRLPGGGTALAYVDTINRRPLRPISDEEIEVARQVVDGVPDRLAAVLKTTPSEVRRCLDMS